MIGPNDLRQILLEDAEDAPAVPAQDLLAGIRHKVKVRRRARLAGAAVAIAAIVAASLAIVPRVIDTSSPEPVEPIPERPHLEFPAQFDGRPVLASHVNEPDSSSVEWYPTLARVVDAEPIAFCRVPDQYAAPVDPEAGVVVLVVAINNDIVATRECKGLDGKGDPSYPPRNGEIAKAGQLDPRDRGILGGQSFTVSIWLQQGENQIEIPSAEFGIGFYEPAISHTAGKFEGHGFPENPIGQ